MKIAEYILLLIAGALVVFLALRASSLETWQIAITLVAVGFLSFQFSLRRQIRKRMNNETKEEKQ